MYWYHNAVIARQYIKAVIWSLKYSCDTATIEGMSSASGIMPRSINTGNGIHFKRIDRNRFYKTMIFKAQAKLGNWSGQKSRILQVRTKNQLSWQGMKPHYYIHKTNHSLQFIFICLYTEHTKKRISPNHTTSISWKNYQNPNLSAFHFHNPDSARDLGIT